MGRPAKKLTVSDALAIGTTGASLIGSFSKGLKYDPNANKPKLFTPSVRPSTGDVNLARHLTDIDAGVAGTNRKIREMAGSDTNKGILGLLQANEGRETAKSGAYASHTQMFEDQEREKFRVLNDADKYNLGRDQSFMDTKQANDIADTREVRKAAKDSLQSGVDYASDRDAYFRDATVKETQANNRIDYLIEKNTSDYEIGMAPNYVGNPEGLAKAVKAHRERTSTALLPSKTYNYNDDPNAVVEPTKRETRKADKAFASQENTPASISREGMPTPDGNVDLELDKLGDNITNPNDKVNADYDLNKSKGSKVRSYLSNMFFGDKTPEGKFNIDFKQDEYGKKTKQNPMNLPGTPDELAKWNYTREQYYKDGNEGKYETEELEKLNQLLKQKGQ